LDDARRERWLFALATSALVLPLVVLAVRVIVHDWSNPGGDIALIELRTRDVGPHTPLLGSYGRYGFSQPGALWFYALALPYRVLGSRFAGMQLADAVGNQDAHQIKTGECLVGEVVHPGKGERFVM